jgi:hypothetical protein
MLAPDLQMAVLSLEAVDGADPMAERTLRAVPRRAVVRTAGDVDEAFGPVGLGAGHAPERTRKLQRPAGSHHHPIAARSAPTMMMKPTDTDATLECDPAYASLIAQAPSLCSWTGAIP